MHDYNIMMRELLLRGTSLNSLLAPRALKKASVSLHSRVAKKDLHKVPGIETVNGFRGLFSINLESLRHQMQAPGLSNYIVITLQNISLTLFQLKEPRSTYEWKQQSCLSSS
jgi:hypothetical protein